MYLIVIYNLYVSDHLIETFFLHSRENMSANADSKLPMAYILHNLIGWCGARIENMLPFETLLRKHPHFTVRYSLLARTIAPRNRQLGRIIWPSKKARLSLEFPEAGHDKFVAGLAEISESSGRTTI